MHRSGTSLTANLLAELGIPLGGELVPADTWNAKGYFEPIEINSIHDAILSLFGMKWNTPTTLHPLPDGWWDAPAVAPYRERLKSIAAKRLSELGTWAFKEPRTSRLLPLWNKIIAELGVDARYVLATRSSAGVTGSLTARDNIDPLISELLWLEHNCDVVLDLPRPLDAIISYEDWIEKPFEQARLMIEGLGIDFRGDDAALRDILARVVEPGMRHHIESAGAYRLPFTAPLYAALRARDAAELKAIAGIFNISRAFVGAVVPYVDRQSKRGDERTSRVQRLETLVEALQAHAASLVSALGAAKREVASLKE